MVFATALLAHDLVSPSLFLNSSKTFSMSQRVLVEQRDDARGDALRQIGQEPVDDPCLRISIGHPAHTDAHCRGHQFVTLDTDVLRGIGLKGALSDDLKSEVLS